jgi:RNA polymerase sigma-70 factor (ECF subfamily)
MEAVNLRSNQKSTSTCSDWVDQYYDRIYPVILRMVSNEDIAKDLTQDAFLRAWEKRDTFRGDSEVGTWLYRIAVNVTLTYLTKNKRMSDTPIDEAILPDGRESIQRKLEKNQDGNLIRQSVEELPDAYKLVIIMHYYEDMKLEQIAKITGISKGTAAWRLFKARNMLTASLRAKGIVS